MPRTKQFDETEVLEKAMSLFWEKGYNGTSMQDLVEGLGINRASIYSTYGDKEALFKRAFKHYRDTNGEWLIGFMREQPSVPEAFRTIFEMSVDRTMNDPRTKGCFAVNVTTEMSPNDQHIGESLDVHKKRVQGLFLEQLKRGEAQGEIPKGKDLAGIAAFLYTYYSGLQVIAKVNPDREELMASVRSALLVLG